MNVMILDIKTADLVYQKADGHQSDVSLLPHWGTGQANPNINAIVSLNIKAFHLIVPQRLLNQPQS